MRDREIGHSDLSQEMKEGLKFLEGRGRAELITATYKVDLWMCNYIG
jgi:hypothetical protein